MVAYPNISDAHPIEQLSTQIGQALRSGRALPGEIAQTFTDIHTVPQTGHILYSPQGNRIMLPLRIGALKWRVMQVDFGRSHQDFEASLPNGNRIQISYSQLQGQIESLKLAVIDVATNESARLYTASHKRAGEQFQAISAERDNLPEIAFFLSSLLSALQGA